MMGYKHFPVNYDIPAADDGKTGYLDNNSIMMKLVSENSNKKMSARYDDEINIPIKPRQSEMDRQEKEGSSPRKTDKAEHKSHSNYKPSIRVRGKEYYQAMVFPMGI